MEKLSEILSVHPGDESQKAYDGGAKSWSLDTPGGRFYTEWDTEVPVTREGQLIFFFQFLHAGGRWKEFLSSCPLTYTGDRGSGAAKVMGTALLSVSRALALRAHQRGSRRRDQPRFAGYRQHGERGRCAPGDGADRGKARARLAFGAKGGPPARVGIAVTATRR